MNNTNVITIEKNIPVPEPIKGVRGESGRYKFVEESLVPGDSFVVNGNTPGITPKAIKAWVYNRRRKALTSALRNRRYAIRTLSGNSTNPTSIRVWRVS